MSVQSTPCQRMALPSIDQVDSITDVTVQMGMKERTIRQVTAFLIYFWKFSLMFHLHVKWFSLQK